MVNCTGQCFELARTLSLNGFTVEVRPPRDRPRTTRSLRYVCQACRTAYELTPARPAAAR